MFHKHGHKHHGHRFARAESHERHHKLGGGRRGRDGLDLRRFFAHGDLRLVILNLIAEKPRHGYEIIKAIEDQAGGAYSPSPGVIYPTLTLLEELGYVVVTPGDGGRKSHDITDAGRLFLAANKPAVEALIARMTEASRARGDGPDPRIIRAMENLKLALRLRLNRGPLDPAQAASVAAALDAAAAAVEQT